ncbi:type II secretion system F family protein [Modestobacter sp. Leaf380]|uniref:type II secretion system F family protein n=1 Tax=Modestobacter sp. Leaf380 TaxID=1736356 RepID=UPI0006FC6306|nr:type II secretion system F family protein [Modestobacter sp. Leaf380]KQS66298.1 type II secretion system protein F [Modestobacter sp. Leaf380]
MSAVELGVACCAGAVLVVALVVLVPRPVLVPRSRLDPSLPPQPAGSVTAAALAVRVHRVLEARGLARPLSAALERAGLQARPGEVVLRCGTAALALGVLGLALTGVLGGLLAAAVVPVGLRIVLGVLTRRRQAAFAEQLDDALQLMAGGLRAGHSVLRAMDALSTDTEPPMSVEFGRVVAETRVGRDLGAALEEVVDRTGNEDLGWVGQAIAVHREVGGNLAEVLDRVGATIRERAQVRRQVQALSAEGRVSGYVLMALPVLALGFLALVSPEYVGRLTSGAGLVLSATGAVLWLVGGVWLRSVVRIAF